MAADPRIFIRQRAAELGFGVCRFASASAPSMMRRLDCWFFSSRFKAEPPSK